MNSSLRNRILDQLEKVCPASVRVRQHPREWAAALLACLVRIHRNDKEEILHHVRSLIFNLKRNGERLAGISPDVLASLPPETLASGTESLRRRRTAQLGGWEPPPERGSQRDRDLPLGSAWSRRKSVRLVLVLNDDATFRAFAERFNDRADRVHAVKGDITNIEGPVDAFVSPSNCMGNMDGGVDRAYAIYFGWSFGRPYHEPNPLQRAIDAEKGKENSTLPIGEALVVRHQGVCVISAPTMALPGKIPTGSTVIYDASQAAFLAWKETDDISIVRMPSFGTGWGQVPAVVAAWQMWDAFVDAWS